MKDFKLKMTFLGSGSAFTVGEDNYQSNVLLEDGEHHRLLIDCGSDVRHALYRLAYVAADIDAVYISHLHNDHIGGLEWLALKRYFTAGSAKPDLYIAEVMKDDLWQHSLQAGLSTLEHEQACLDSYFNVYPISEEASFRWGGVKFHLQPMIHVNSNHQPLPCFGLLFRVGEARVFFSADTRFTPGHLQQCLEDADVIFHDCETQANQSGVHAHYSALKTLPADIKQKMWLYHYNPGILPDAKADGFLGFVQRGSVFYF